MVHYKLVGGETIPSLQPIQFTQKELAKCDDLPDVKDLLIKKSASLV